MDLRDFQGFTGFTLTYLNLGIGFEKLFQGLH